MNASYTALLPDLIRLIKKAGDAVMPFYLGKHAAVFEKEGGRPVTEADYASNAIIMDGLKTLTPHIPIISEETSGVQPDISQGSFWTVDPLDDTRQFIEGTNGFSILIGLVINHEPIIGLVYHPARNVLYVAAEGSAYKQDMSGVIKPIQVSAFKARREKGLNVAVNERYSDLKTAYNLLGLKDGDHLASQMKIAGYKVDDYIRKSDTYLYALLAEGVIDVLPNIGRRDDKGAWLWDVVPGLALVKAAGGFYKDLKGEDLQLGTSENQLRLPAHQAMSHLAYLKPPEKPAPSKGFSP
jgi:3'(2'), 5'-bisphosphate nucleotidase